MPCLQARTLGAVELTTCRAVQDSLYSELQLKGVVDKLAKAAACSVLSVTDSFCNAHAKASSESFGTLGPQ